MTERLNLILLLLIVTASSAWAQSIDTCESADNSTTLENCYESEQQTVQQTQVANVQILLNGLGLDAGPADGIPGAETRNALNDFYARTGLSHRTTFDSTTAFDLKQELEQLSNALRILAESQQADAEGKTSLALIKLDEAVEKSRLLQVPVSYQQDLQSKLAGATVSTSDFNQLMEKIQVMENKIENQEATIERNKQFLRSAARDIFNSHLLRKAR